MKNTTFTIIVLFCLFFVATAQITRAPQRGISTPIFTKQVADSMRIGTTPVPITQWTNAKITIQNGTSGAVVTVTDSTLQGGIKLPTAWSTYTSSVMDSTNKIYVKADQDSVDIFITGGQL